MTDQQCGLCLSCGAPFLPDIDDVDFFNREANLSILFLNTQFKRNADILQTYEVPKLCSQRQASHIVHVSYHQTALDYMCNRHTRDNDVGGPIAANQVIPNQINAPFLYYHTVTGKKGPRAACWPRPARNERLKFSVLSRWIIGQAQNGSASPVAQSLNAMYDMCLGCNALMTQKSHFRFLLGLRGAGAKNGRGTIILGPVIDEHEVTAMRAPLEAGYGTWQVANAPNTRQTPAFSKADSEAPCIAYYLHMCLPYTNQGANHNYFQLVPPNLQPTARSLYLELCWLILEIACLATLLQEGTVTKPRNMKRSHGMHQHRGVLDLYVSYFFWRMMQFELGADADFRRLDFVQWHQKYFWDARNCPEFLDAADRQQLIGEIMFNSTVKSSRELVEEICEKLTNFYKEELGPLRVHVTGRPNFDPNTEEYFLPVRAVRALRNKALEATRNDFQSAVGKFGISALLFRLIDLCEGYPTDFLRQLKDFRASWQWREIERVRLGHPGLEAKAAYRLYFMCTLLFPPADNADPCKDDDTAFMAQDEFCSPWNAVMSLQAIGAFRYQAIDVPEA